MKLVRFVRLTAGATVLLAVSGCGSSEPTVMPDVVGRQLDVAESDIERAGFGGEVEVVGGGLFGILDKSNWMVCEQEPAEGEVASEPRLVVERECRPTESVEPSAEPIEPSAAPADPIPAPSPAVVTDTTVDELLDRLNSADMGGAQIGDQFRLTGELFESDAWFTGATGDYAVYLKAKGGADDLLILVDEADAAGWRDGTRLELIVENVERTINGETSSGWLSLVTATTLP